MDIYNSVRSVPKEAQKPIEAGRLRGKTDINPMWRMQVLTEKFGAVGFGWQYEIVEKRLETAPNGEIAAFVHIKLFVRDPESGEWSAPIVGIGGSMFVANESKGSYVSDECFKMALTDAISVSCKALGIGADVYWEKGSTKYSEKPTQTQPKNQPKQKPEFKPLWLEDEEKKKKLFAWIFESEDTPENRIRSTYDITDQTLSDVLKLYEKFMNNG